MTTIASVPPGKPLVATALAIPFSYKYAQGTAVMSILNCSSCNVNFDLGIGEIEGHTGTCSTKKIFHQK